MTAPSPRELQVLGLLAAGNTAEDVAALLGTSFYTVRAQIHQARLKLGARTIAQAVAIVCRQGLLPQEDPS